MGIMPVFFQGKIRRHGFQSLKKIEGVGLWKTTPSLKQWLTIETESKQANWDREKLHDKRALQIHDVRLQVSTAVRPDCAPIG